MVGSGDGEVGESIVLADVGAVVDVIRACLLATEEKKLLDINPVANSGPKIRELLYYALLSISAQRRCVLA